MELILISSNAIQTDYCKRHCAVPTYLLSIRGRVQEKKKKKVSVEKEKKQKKPKAACAYGHDTLSYCIIQPGHARSIEAKATAMLAVESLNNYPFGPFFADECFLKLRCTDLPFFITCHGSDRQALSI